MRFFNNEGLVRADLNYRLPPLERWDMEGILTLIAQQKYFLLHAPRQTGKTTCLLALMDYLNHEGHYRAVYANIEAAQAMRENVEQGMSVIVCALAHAVWRQGEDCLETWLGTGGHKVPGGDRLFRPLGYWAAADPRPAVLLLDEVDALVGDTLISLLLQLRAGYTQRPDHFP